MPQLDTLGTADQTTGLPHETRLNCVQVDTVSTMLRLNYKLMVTYKENILYKIPTPGTNAHTEQECDCKHTYLIQYTWLPKEVAD